MEGSRDYRARPGDPVPGRSIRLILGMDRCHGRFRVFQCQIELVRIGLLGLAPEGCLFEGRDSFSSRSIRSSLRAIWASQTHLKTDRDRTNNGCSW